MKNKTTLINFISNSLGDNIAFSVYADLYQKKYGGLVYVKTIWHNILHSNNPNVFFVNKDYEDSFDVIKDIYFKFQEGPMQKIICETLDLEYQEIKPLLKEITKYKFNKKKKYVCISVHSTSQMKYWNDNGWKKVVSYIKSLGYDVYAIDKDEIFGEKGKWNKIPNGAINETGDYPIEYRIEQIKNCAFFIGLSSGLSWLAWALNKKVVMISGCTSEDNEFKENNYRVINKNVCNGCLNDSSIDNEKNIAKNWKYCPRNKDFECSKEITFEMVKDKIDNCIINLYCMTDEEKKLYIEFAKFLQTTILEKNIPCYLIGGSLINSIRDNGVLLTDDIDFAIISEEKDNSVLNFLMNAIVNILPFCTWNIKESMIIFKLYGRDDMKIDIFLFIKKNINYYMYDIAWINERIQNFQTFKEQKVILENKEFYTLYRPDLFLTTVYGDWLSPKKDYYNVKGGDTKHLRECIFYSNDESFDKIDFQVENLKIFFQSVVVKRSINNIDNKLINVFDTCYSKQINKKTNLFYEDFIYFLIKNKISFDNF